VDSAHVLVITNDFPPRTGGIQTYVWEIVRRMNPADVTVLTSEHEGWQEFDATAPMRIVRAKTKVLLPNNATKKLVREIIAQTGATKVVYGAAAPLGLLSPLLRKLGVQRIVAMTMGHEAGWAITPVTRQLLIRIARHADVLTYLSGYTRDRITRVLPAHYAQKFVRLPAGVDTSKFSPDNNTYAKVLRVDLGWEDNFVVSCISRLEARKGQDTLIRNLAQLREQVPNAKLLIVGDGKYRETLEKLVVAHKMQDHVRFTGNVPYEELGHWYAVGDVFAMPCRTRNMGWDVEGLGIVYLEASATGLPVIAGDSGGAPDAVAQEVSGYVVASDQQLVERLVELANDPQLRARLGQQGRQWVKENWNWDNAAAQLEGLLVEA
jgi:phosphatidylinositol alpha-1,6-mannosyltransferase